MFCLDVALEAGIDYPTLLRQYRIKFTGLEPPNPITSIPELASKLPEESLEILRLIGDNWKSMGLKKPTGIQMASWGVMLEVSLISSLRRCKMANGYVEWIETRSTGLCTNWFW